MMETEFSM